MILALDIDNTAITVGGFDEEQICFTAEVSTNYLRTAMEYAVMVKSILDIHGVGAAQIEGGIIANQAASTATSIADLKAGRVQVPKGPYTGVHYADPADRIDLSGGYGENRDSSAPGFCYILDGIVTIREN